MASVECPSSFHVYRRGGFFGEDKIVKGDDRITSKYYLRGSRDASQWKFALHAGGPDGVLICRTNSPYVGPPIGHENDGGPIIITMSSERRLFHVIRADGVHLFKGPDDQEYRWQAQSHLWRNKLQCLDAQGNVVATYRVTSFAMSKDGELRVNPSGQFMIDLLVATCLAVRTPDH